MSIYTEDVEVWEFRVPAGMLTELQVMDILVSLLARLTPEETTRVLRWAMDRHEADNT